MSFLRREIVNFVLTGLEINTEALAHNGQATIAKVELVKSDILTNPTKSLLQFEVYIKDMEHHHHI